MVRLHGVDISGYQPDWTPAAGDAFVFVKATEGRTFASSSRTAQVARARAAGLVVGFYHFMWPGSPLEQAAWFIQQAKPLPGDLLVCDWEKPGTSCADKDAFIREVKRLAPQCRVGLYCNTSWWLHSDTTSFYGDFLWIADYRGAEPPIKARWLFWQYSDKPIDQNWCRFETRAEFDVWARGLIPVPPPPPPVPDPKPTPPPPPPPKPKPLPVRSLLSLNAQWPGFASTHTELPWTTRCRMIAEAILKSTAPIVTIQELGPVEAGQLSAHLPGWSYQRAQGGGHGLNCVFWRRDTCTYVKTYDWNLDSFGQMQRTLLAVKLQYKDGAYVWAGSTHLAAGPDLTKAEEIKARTAQTNQVADLLGGFRQIAVGADWNSPYPQTVASSVRGILHARGFTFRAPLRDPKHNGIDGVGAKQRVTLLTEAIYPLGKASDHDGRLVTFTVPKG